MPGARVSSRRLGLVALWGKCNARVCTRSVSLSSTCVLLVALRLVSGHRPNKGSKAVPLGCTAMLHDNGYTDGSGPRSARLQTALVAPLPTPIDVKNDIVLQGKADKWQRELKSALRTRGLLRACEEDPPELMDVIRASESGD